MTDYNKICFVIMPFGEKKVGDKTVDFDQVYDEIFEPTIKTVPLPDPESGTLEPRRTDRDFFAGDISSEMFNYIEYSRIALTDISGLNANVFYELGHRHRARQAGTAIFRQTDAPIPFDINQIKAFSYEFESEEKVTESIELIKRVLTESLQQVRPDSPIRRALDHQRQTGGDAERLVKEAENSIRNLDTATAIAKYREAVAIDEGNPLLRLNLGLLLKNQGDWPEALEEFTRAVSLAPDYGEAYREKGVAENKLWVKSGEDPTGEETLRKAVTLNPEDFDALAALGGVLKRKGALEESLEAYEDSTKVSHGHSYPLLNAIKLRAAAAGRLEIDRKTQLMLRRANRSRQAQVKNEPPYDAPWSFFDLAEIRLFLGDEEGFLENLQGGIEVSEHSWQPGTCRNSLALLDEAGIEVPGLQQGLAELTEAVELLDD